MKYNFKEGGNMLENLSTEHRNEKTTNLDEMSIKEVLQSMNEEDRTVALAVEKEIEQIEKVVQTVIKSFEAEGRLIYIGVGYEWSFRYFRRSGMPADIWHRR